MNKILSKIRIEIIDWIGHFFFVSPFIALFVIGSGFILNIYSKSAKFEAFPILIGAISITAAISGLSLRVCSICDDSDKDRKAKFAYAGERLLHATILFSLAAVMVYLLKQFDLNASYLLNGIIFLFVFIPSSLFFSFGLMYSVNALSVLHRVLYKDNEKPFD